jgi:hypothetical protein
MLCGRGIELDLEFNATAERHHDGVGARLRPRSPHFVGKGHAIDAHNLGRNAPKDAGAVYISEVQADVGIRRGIDQTPSPSRAGSCSAAIGT